MIRATDLAHRAVSGILKAGDWAVDATAGNGHDTVLLAECVGPTGRVFAFDVQQCALAETARWVEGLAQVTLVHAGHETLARHLAANGPEDGEARLAAVMFNLGYLPGADKTIVTRTETTLAALKQALDHLGTNGLVTLVLYPGHPGGAEEAAAVRYYAQRLPEAFAVSLHERSDTQRPAPELLVIERLTECAP